MNETVQILAPFNNVNDETVVVLEWFFPDMAEVKKGDIILSFETSKANVEIEAPADGYLIHKAEVGDEVPIGGVLASIISSIQSSPENSNKTLNEPDPLDIPTEHKNGSLNGLEVTAFQKQDDRKPRFTPVAKRMIESLGIEYSNFAGQHLVRSDDVLAVSTNPQAEASTRIWPATRFTSHALSLMREHSLSAEIFHGAGLVRSEDVLEHLKHGNPPVEPSIINSSSVLISTSHVQPTITHSKVPTVEVRKVIVSKRKKAEIRNLSIGQSASITSNITVACNTQGLRIVLQSQSALKGNPTALIVFEVARLLHHYPAFNAYYAAGEICYYEEINIGFAIDAGFGLKVPVIKNADKKSLTQIAEDMNTSISLYLEDRLGPEHLTGGTFTISDLSGEGVFSFSPLISEGQSAILGIGGENLLNENSGIFTLTLSFDHQTAEGRKAAQFLNRLKQHLSAYEDSLLNKSEVTVYTSSLPTTFPDSVSTLSASANLECHRCLRDMNSLNSLRAYLVPTVDENRTVRLICTICMGGF